jgi:cytochrome P450
MPETDSAPLAAATAATAAPAYPAPRRSGCPLDPPPLLGELREEAPVSRVTLWDGSRAWLVTRLADVRQALRDPRLSADMHHPAFPFLSPAARALRSARPNFLRMDPPEHDRQRRMLTQEFMIKRVEAMRPQVEGIVESLIDEMVEAGSPADLVSRFALPLPSLVICHLLGVPYEDHEFFQGCSRTLLDQTVPVQLLTAARDELIGYLDRLVARKAEQRTDDLLGRLITAQEEPGHLERRQVVDMALLLLVAGHETTANMTALSVLELLRRPGRWELLRERPELLPGAVDELLRLHSIVQTGLPRVAVADMEIGGARVAAGEPVLLSVVAANRDPRAFEQPDELDLERNARGHVAFGFGVHQCLGQPLARLELQCALGALTRRLPGLRLDAAVEELDYRHSMIVFGLFSLPVAW